ncbi:flagellar motor switch protein FliM [Clostridium cylindrosporum]|uniref:Flagellar motor switch protein FliM n=1 Tax=Clostridium cylindrosporum DSM 605 TaxID=1121307 RepID=A0A0J8DBL3_CLOCY|nr:flagellar motor switch protein FliM [Clostridium cylindrosporum]KMT21683.1 flagellar motor switch protein FliM [Clostridium cylindrosporum DSM 605]
MSEVLSQSEIDALLAALSTGEIGIEEDTQEEKQRVKKYDFKRPNKFSKDHTKTLERVHDNFARIASNYLAAHLRTSVQIHVISSEQITFEEFIHSIPNPTILMTYYLDPFSGPFLFETGPQFVFQVIDILFGGQGKSVLKTREFTDIEKNVIKRINEKLLENLKLAWEDIMDIDVRIDGLETNPVLNQSMAPNEPVSIITMSVELSNNKSFINMCIPYISIEKFIEKLVFQYKAATSASRDDEHKKQMERKIQGVILDSHVELGKSIVSVNDFLHLRIGDCITLNRKTSEPLDMYVEKRKHFKVYPGNIGRKTGVQIVEILDKDVEDNE